MEAKSAKNADVRAMSEGELQSSVIELAQLLGWRVAHFRTALSKSGHWMTPVQGDGAGFPDLILVRERVIAAELKAERGRMSPEQDTWLRAFLDAGVLVAVWKPRDWFNGTIEATLRESRFPRLPEH